LYFCLSYDKAKDYFNKLVSEKHWISKYLIKTKLEQEIVEGLIDEEIIEEYEFDR